MRNYLQDLNIVGVTCVFQEGDICRHTIEQLIEHCDKVIISMDYPDEKTLAIIKEYETKYPDIIVAEQNDVPPLEEGQRIMRRHRKHQGKIRDYALRMVKKEHDKRSIDILLYPDSDEIYTNNLPNLLQEFWESKKVDCIFIKPIDVYDDMHIVINRGMISHARIYKYVPEITARPYRQQTFYSPYHIERKIWKRSWNYVHLAKLTKENRDFRVKLRTGTPLLSLKLKRISKPANELTPKEGQKIHEAKEFLRLGDYDGDIEKIPLIL